MKRILRTLRVEAYSSGIMSAFSLFTAGWVKLEPRFKYHCIGIEGVIFQAHLRFGDVSGFELWGENGGKIRPHT